MHLFIVLVTLAWFGCTTTPTPPVVAKGPNEAAGERPSSPKKSLFARLGGRAAVEAVVDDFLGRVARDQTINSGFAVSHVPRVRQRLVELICAGTGGPCTYSGRDMEKAHAGQGITNSQFDALVGHLVATLDKYQVPTVEKGELLALLAPMRAVIVEAP
jgi:hemoglobin